MPTDAAPTPPDAIEPSTPPPFRLSPTIVTLTHNVKGPWRKVVLPPKVVLVGLNRSGKTAIVQALELALAGKCQRRGEGLLSKGVDLVGLHLAGRGILASDAQGAFMAVDTAATAPRGEFSARFSVTGTQNAAATPMHARSLPTADYDSLFPVGRVAEILDGSAETARKAILTAVSDRVDAVIVSAAMKEVGVTRAVFEAAGIDPRILKPRGEESRLSALVRAHESVAAETRRLGGVATGADEATEASAPAAAGAVGDFEEKVVAAREACEAAEAAVASAADARTVALESRRLHLQDRPPEPVLPEYVKLGVQAAAAMRPIVADHEHEAAQIGPSAPAAPRCPVCTWPLSTERLDRARDEARRVAGVVRDAKVAHAAEFADQRAPFDLGVMEAERKVAEAERVAGDARQALYAAETALAASRTTAQAIVEGAVEGAANAKARADACTRLRDRLFEVRNKVLEGAVDALAADLSRASGLAVGIVLNHGKREVAQVGVWAGGPPGRGGAKVLHTDLSGADWARLVAAFVAVSRLTEKVPYRCVVLPDRQLDPKSLVDVCMVMGAEVDAGRVSQVIIQRTAVPEMLPAGWAVVNVHQNVMPVVTPDWAMPVRKGKRGDHGDAGELDDIDDGR